MSLLTGSGLGGSNLILPSNLGLLGEPFFGVSVRKLNNSYAGNCMRVRRSSDNTEQNIAFAGDYIDTASLLSFVGAGDGFVTTWYEQYSGLDLAQTVNSRQPQVVFSGALLTSNGILILDFTSDKGLRVSGITESYNSAFAVLESPTAIWGGFHSAFDSSLQAPGGPERSGGLLESGNTGIHSNRLPSAAWRNSVSVTPSVTALAPINELFLYDWNVASGRGTLSGISLGNRDGATTGGSAYCPEVIAYASEPSDSLRSTIRSNILSYYSI